MRIVFLFCCLFCVSVCHALEVRLKGLDLTKWEKKLYYFDPVNLNGTSAVPIKKISTQEWIIVLANDNKPIEVTLMNSSDIRIWHFSDSITNIEFGLNHPPYFFTWQGKDLRANVLSAMLFQQYKIYPTNITTAYPQFFSIEPDEYMARLDSLQPLWLAATTKYAGTLGITGKNLDALKAGLSQSVSWYRYNLLSSTFDYLKSLQNDHYKNVVPKLTKENLDADLSTATISFNSFTWIEEMCLLDYMRDIYKNGGQVKAGYQHDFMHYSLHQAIKRKPEDVYEAYCFYTLKGYINPSSPGASNVTVRADSLFSTVSYTMLSDYSASIADAKKLLKAHYPNSKYWKVIEAREKKVATLNPGATISNLVMTDTLGQRTDLYEVIKKGNKPVVVLFWADWCHFCKELYPHMRKAYKQFGPDINFVFVSIDRNESFWKASRKKTKLPGSHYYVSPDESYLLQRFDIGGIPKVFVLSTENKIVAYNPEVKSSLFDSLLNTLKPANN